MQKIQPIEYGKYYHIFNKGINGTNLFLNNGNYTYFLELYKKYIPKIADTFAYCLLKNHFHVLHQKETNQPLTGLEATVRVSQKKYKPSSQFSHLFNSYAQAFNKQNNRSGSLFKRPFERRLIDTEKYFIELVTYIHNNPVHHGFVDKITDYPWLSYFSYFTNKPTNLKKEMVIDWFGGLENFKYVHNKKQEYTNIEKYIIE